jgi:hypothetical protein
MNRTVQKQKPIPRQAFEEMANMGFVAIENPDGRISFVPRDLLPELLRKGCKRAPLP